MRQSAVKGPCACFCLALLCVVSASFACAEKSLGTGITSIQVSAKVVAHYIMGVSHDLLDDVPNAIREYEQAAQAGGEALMPRLRLASLYVSVESFDAAISILKKILQVSPDDKDARLLLATAYMSAGQKENAFKEVEQVLKKISFSDPLAPAVYFLLGKLYYSVNKVDKAIEQFEKIFELKPDDTEMAYLLGGYYFSLGKNARAVPFFQQCIRMDPLHASCLNGLGYLYAEEGLDLDVAEALVKRALEIDPQHAAFLDSLGWVYYQKGLYFEALKELSAAAEQIDDPTIYEHLGDVYNKLGERSLAETQWQKSLALDPDRPSVRVRLNDVKGTPGVLGGAAQ